MKDYILNTFHQHVAEACEQKNITEEKALEQVVKAGFRGLDCDLTLLGDHPERKSLFDAFGLQVSSLNNHFDFAYDSSDVTRDKIARFFDTAEYFGAKSLLCVPGLIHKGDDKAALTDKMADWISYMCEKAKPMGLNVTLEDFDNVLSPCCNTEGLLYFIKKVPDVRISFDSGNFAYVLEDAATALKTFLPYITHVHLKDRSRDASRANETDDNYLEDLGGQKMYPCETCEGYIGVPDLIRTLVESGYKGTFTLEHFFAVDQLAYMTKSAHNVQKVLASL